MRRAAKILFSAAFLFTLHSSLFTENVRCDISDKDLEDIYDQVLEDVQDEKIGYDDINTDELDDFRTNPLDLNTAARADLMKLPLMSPRLVINIIKYRVRHHGFREMEELKDVPGMTNNIYEKVRPFLTIYTEAEKERLRGDLRITHKLDLPSKDKEIESPAYFHHPESIQSRLRFFYSDNIEVSFTAKRNAWGGPVNWENLRRYYLVSNYLYAKNYLGFDTFVVGAFKLNFERGLALGSVSKTITSVQKEKKGVEPYRSSNKNAGFYGLAVQKNNPVFSWAAFYSDKYLTEKLNPDGTAKSVSSSVNFSYSSQDKFNYLNDLKDKTFGGWTSFPFRNMEFYLMGYHEAFSPCVLPVERDEEYWWDEEEQAAYDESAVKYIRYKFSGDRNDIYGTGFKTAAGNANFYFDYAMSVHGGYSSNVDKTSENAAAKAFQFASVYNYSYTTILVGIQRFDSDYYNFHISGDSPVEKMFAEAKTKTKKLKMKWNGQIWRELNPLKAVTIKKYYKTYLQLQYPLTKKFKVLGKYTFQNEDKRLKQYYETSTYIQEPVETELSRLQFTWSPSSYLRIRWQYDTKMLVYEGNNNVWDYSSAKSELKYRFNKSFQIISSIKMDKNPGAYKNKYEMITIKPKMKFSRSSNVSMSFSRKIYSHTPEYYDPAYGVFDYTYDKYTYDGEDPLTDVVDSFQVKYTLKF